MYREFPADPITGSLPDWIMRPWGDELQACTRFQDKAQANIVSVVDVGSNSVKQAIFKRPQTPGLPPTLLLKDDELCGLAQRMVPNDKKPKFDKDALALATEKVLPRFHKAAIETQADTVIVLCTEAVRAVHQHDPGAAQNFCRTIAHKLHIPDGAVNILSDKMEARLAVEAIYHGDEDPDGFSVMMGGGSTEIARYIKGQTSCKDYQTLHFGTLTLSNVEDQQTVIAEAFDTALFFRRKFAEGNDAKRTGRLYLEGGAFRALGRELAKRIYKTNYGANVGFEGTSFVAGEEFDGHLNELLLTDKEGLLRAFLRSDAKPTKDMSDREFQHWLKSKKYEAWLKSPEYEKWDNRIGRRAHLFKPAIYTIRAAIERTGPRTVVFWPHSIREGVMRYAGLG